jgi:hypothetical protein
VAVDQNGFVYIVGNTFSPDLPTTPGAFQRKYKGDNAGGNSGDGYVAKLTADGKNVVWATYLGGSGGDRPYNVLVDSSGYVYVALWTNSPDFPTTAGACDTTFNGRMDLAYVKMKSDGSGLVWSTFVGASRVEQARGSIALDSSGNLYSSGWTDSPDFPTTAGAYQTTRKAGQDAFLLKLSADGSRLIFSTLFGGSGDDNAFSGVQVHSDGTVYIAGLITSQDLPVSANAFQKIYGGDAAASWGNGDAFVARFSADGSRLIYSTYLGGLGNENVSAQHGLSVDASGRAVVIGETTSTNFPVSANAFQKATRGGVEGFVSILSSDGSRLVASTYIGGSADEETSGLAIDRPGNVYFSGNTKSSDYPASGDAYQKTYKGGAGNTDVWFTKLSPDLSALLYSTYLGGSGSTGGFGDRGRALVLDSAGDIIIGGDTNSPDFPITPGAYQSAYKGGVDAFVAKFSTGGVTPPPPRRGPSSTRQ